MTQEPKLYYTFISIFGDKPGHSVHDVRFYMDVLLASGVDFEYYIPCFCVKQLDNCATNSIIMDVNDDGSWKAAFKMARQIKIKNGSRVIFTGYTEKVVLAFMLLNLFYSYSLILSATNNFSVGRVLNNKWMLKLFFMAVSHRLVRLVLHSAKEVELCRSISASLADKTQIKKHHQMLPRAKIKTTSRIDNKLRISFFGPVKRGKPLAPLLSLIRSDATAKYNYHVYNVGNIPTGIQDELGSLSNVFLRTGYMSDSELMQAVQQSYFVFLSHDRSSEGLLSGNLMDCLSNHVPYISGLSQINLDYEEQYGSLGVTANFDSDEWPRSFLLSDYSEVRQEFVRNITQLNKSYSQRALLESCANSYL